MKKIMGSWWTFWLMEICLVIIAFLPNYNKITRISCVIIATGIVGYWGINSLIAQIKQIKETLEEHMD